MQGDTHDLVGHYEEIVLLRDHGDLFEFFPAEDLANGVVRGVDDDHLGARCDGATWL